MTSHSIRERGGGYRCCRVILILGMKAGFYKKGIRIALQHQDGKVSGLGETLTLWPTLIIGELI